MTIFEEALEWHALGYTPMPLAIDGSKRPWVDDWRTFTENPPTTTDIRAIFGRRENTQGLGLLCGRGSGGLEMLELEGRAVKEGLLTSYAAALTDNGFGDLWQRVNSGYVELTPSGGMHWYYRVDGEPMPNTKIARRPATPAELEDAPGERFKVLIETRGQGGFTIVAPSAGTSHTSGREWVVVIGNKTTVPTITADERDALYAIGSLFDTTPTVAHPTHTVGTAVNLYGGERPGDDYNARAVWDDILDGWVKVHHFGGNAYGWRRPGKDIGISATTGRNEADNLYVFTTSTEFEAERAYSKFAAYTLLNFAGDYSAAARALSIAGYGTPPPVSPPTRHLTAVDGTSARALNPEPDTLPADEYGPTEDGTARMLVTGHAHELRFCPQRGQWLTWDGHRWEWDEAGRHREMIRRIARALPDDPGWPIYKKRALSASGVSGISRLGQTDKRMVVHIDQLDAKPYELNTPGGIIDLRSGTLRPSDPAALHTRMTTATPDFDATSPTFDKFLKDTFPDPHLRDYIARVLGLSCIGAVLENILPFGYGVGANGKTTLYEACAHALGTGETGYSISAPSEMLMMRRHTEHLAELAQLAGARLVICSELDDGQKFAEARVKLLTGGDSINARFMRGNHFSFKPSHTLHLLGNHKPAAATGGAAFWRRVQLIPFDHVVPEEKRDTLLGEKLADAAPAVLAWLARGAADYLTNGLRVPDIVRKATTVYATDQDTIGRFVAEECHTADSDLVRVKTSVLRTAYDAWCSEVGEHPVTAKRLTTELTERFGVGSARNNAARFYTRIALLNLDPDDDEPVTDDTKPVTKPVTLDPNLTEWWNK